MDKIVEESIKAISEGGNITRSCMSGEGSMKKDMGDDKGHKKGRQPDGTGGKKDKMKKIKNSTPK